MAQPIFPVEALEWVVLQLAQVEFTQAAMATHMLPQLGPPLQMVVLSSSPILVVALERRAVTLNVVSVVQKTNAVVLAVSALRVLGK